MGRASNTTRKKLKDKTAAADTPVEDTYLSTGAHRLQRQAREQELGKERSRRKILETPRKKADRSPTTVSGKIGGQRGGQKGHKTTLRKRG